MNMIAHKTFVLEIEQLAIANAALIYRALTNKTRQQLLRMIHDKRKMTVTELYEKLNVEQSAVSKNLAILRRSGLVLSERQGRQIFYSINYSSLQLLHVLSSTLLNPPPKNCIPMEGATTELPDSHQAH